MKVENLATSDKFDKHCDVGNLITLICHITSHEHMSKESRDVMDGSPSWYVTNLSSAVVIDMVVVGICFNYHCDKLGDQRHCNKGVSLILISYVNSHDHMFKESCNIMVGSPSWQLTTLSSLVAIDMVVVEI